MTATVTKITDSPRLRLRTWLRDATNVASYVGHPGYHRPREQSEVVRSCLIGEIAPLMGYATEEQEALVAWLWAEVARLEREAAPAGPAPVIPIRPSVPRPAAERRGA